MIKFFKSFYKNTSGSIMPAFALLIFPVMVGVGVAIDYTSHYHNRTVTLNSADAVLLSVAAEARDLVNQRNYDDAEEQIKAKILPLLQDSLAKYSGLSFEIADVKYHSVSQKLVLDVKISQDTTFMSIANIDKMETVITTGVSLNRLSKNALSIAYVLDRSGSMKGEKWEDLKNAITSMQTNFDDVDYGKRYVRTGVVLFNNKSLGFSGFDWGMEHVVTTIEGQTKITGGTNSSGAMLEAYNALRTNAENDSHNVRNNSEMRKIILFLTDGDNNYQKDVVSTRETCQRAKNEDIEIYSVAFGENLTNTAKALMKTCANDDEHYFVAEQSDQLEEVFKNIGESAATRFYLTQ